MIKYFDFFVNLSAIIIINLKLYQIFSKNNCDYYHNLNSNSKITQPSEFKYI